LNGTWKTYDLVIGDNDSSPPSPPNPAVVSISPIAHYEMGQLPGHTCSGGGDYCSRSTFFQWRGDGKCTGKFVCCTLDGNICGNYGLNVSHVAASSKGSKGETNYLQFGKAP
jgi:hypothetical protein